MTNIDCSKLMLSAQRALLFNITSAIRFISIDVSDAGILKVLVYFDKSPSDAEKDMVYSVAGEMCGDFVELHNSEVEIITTRDAFDNLKQLKYLVYAKSD